MRCQPLPLHSHSQQARLHGKCTLAAQPSWKAVGHCNGASTKRAEVATVGVSQGQTRTQGRHQWTQSSQNAAGGLELACSVQLVCILKNKVASHSSAAAELLYPPANCQVPDVALDGVHIQVAGVAGNGLQRPNKVLPLALKPLQARHTSWWVHCTVTKRVAMISWSALLQVASQVRQD